MERYTLPLRCGRGAVYAPPSPVSFGAQTLGNPLSFRSLTVLTRLRAWDAPVFSSRCIFIHQFTRFGTETDKNSTHRTTSSRSARTNFLLSIRDLPCRKPTQNSTKSSQNSHKKVEKLAQNRTTLHVLAQKADKNSLRRTRSSHSVRTNFLISIHDVPCTKPTQNPTKSSQHSAQKSSKTCTKKLRKPWGKLDLSVINWTNCHHIKCIRRPVAPHHWPFRGGSATWPLSRCLLVSVLFFCSVCLPVCLSSGLSVSASVCSLLLLLLLLLLRLHLLLLPLCVRRAVRSVGQRRGK